MDFEEEMGVKYVLGKYRDSDEWQQYFVQALTIACCKYYIITRTSGADTSRRPGIVYLGPWQSSATLDATGSNRSALTTSAGTLSFITELWERGFIIVLLL